MRSCAYLVMFGVALFKDFILDYIGIGSLPVIGSVVTIITSGFIGAVVFLMGSSGKSKKAKRIVSKLGILVGGTIFESLFFGLNFLPIETATVFLIYLLDRKERKTK